jgi:hypothetical protein
MTELGEFAKYLAFGFVGLGLLFGPIGAAIARRIGGPQPPRGVDPADLEEIRGRLGEIEAQQVRMAELEERVDFAERLLAGGAPPAQLESEGHRS